MGPARILLLTFLVATAAVGLAGCGGDSDAEELGPPPKVPVALVPEALQGGAFSLREDRQAREAFAKIPDQALVADGRLFQIREGSRLVGTLQLSTVKNKLDLGNPEHRATIVNHTLPGAKQEIEVSGVEVATSDANDKTVYLWFGRRVFQVLQLKGSRLDPDAILEELIGFQAAQPTWEPVPAPSEEEEEE